MTTDKSKEDEVVEVLKDCFEVPPDIKAAIRLYMKGYTSDDLNNLSHRVPDTWWMNTRNALREYLTS